jgi:hypothetical protein
MVLVTAEQNHHLAIEVAAAVVLAAQPLQEPLQMRVLVKQVLFLEQAPPMQVVGVVAHMEAVLQREPAVARLVVMV